MSQFVAYDPKVEVNGATIISVVEGMGDEAQPILATHGLDHVEPDQWYPQQTWLDVFKEIAGGEYNAMFNLVGIGMRIPENAAFPPDINSIPSALMSLDVAYHMNHRYGAIGSYKSTPIGENQIDVVCENPYPCDFDYGIIYGLTKRFRTPGTAFTVHHDDSAPCRQKGDESCTYHVHWK